MINKKKKEKITEEARKFFKGANGCHDWSHVERVTSLALNIGKKEGANLDIVELAAILHDIGRKKEMDTKGKICHAIEGSKLAENILKKYNFKESDIENIKHCIISHRFRNNNKPETIEAKVLFDADKLDSIGVVGLARSFLFSGLFGVSMYTGNEKRLSKTGKDYSYTKEDSPIMEYEVKLKKVKGKMLTKTGKKLAKERHKIMVNFVKEFWKEVKGKK